MDDYDYTMYTDLAGDGDLLPIVEGSATREERVPLLTAQEAADRLGVTVDYVQSLCRTGLFSHARKVQRAWVIPVADVAEWQRGKRLWALIRVDRPRREIPATECFGAVVQARNEAEARQIVAQERGEEGSALWMDQRAVIAHELDAGLVQDVVLLARGDRV